MHTTRVPAVCQTPRIRAYLYLPMSGTKRSQLGNTSRSCPHEGALPWRVRACPGGRPALEGALPRNYEAAGRTGISGHFQTPYLIW